MDSWTFEGTKVAFGPKVQLPSGTSQNEDDDDTTHFSRLTRLVPTFYVAASRLYGQHPCTSLSTHKEIRTATLL